MKKIIGEVVEKSRNFAEGEVLGEIQGESVVFITWMEERSDAEGSTWDEKMEGVVWKDKRYKLGYYSKVPYGAYPSRCYYPTCHGRCWYAVERAVKENISLEQILTICREERKQELALKKAERERKEKQARVELRKRLTDSRTKKDQKRKAELLGIVGRKAKFFNKDRFPFIPYARPYLRGLEPNEVSKTELEAMSIGKKEEAETGEKFVCPFCGTSAEKNEACSSCQPRITTGFKYSDLRDLQWDPFKESWPELVKKHWRLMQHQCKCGQWADTPICPQCQENFEKEQALAKFKAATRGWIGKKVKVETFAGPFDGSSERERKIGPITLCDRIVEIVAEENKEDSWRDNDSVFIVNNLLIKFVAGSILEINFYRVLKISPGIIELEWEVGHKYSSPKFIRLSLLKGDEKND